MFVFIITIHVIACALLILIVLIQQGKGGGLIGSLSSAESIFGTKTNTFLIKSTSVLAVVFFITCLSLAFLSIRKNKSLIETSYKPATTTQAQAAAQVPAPATPKKEAPKAAAVAETPAPAQSSTPAPAQTPSAP